MASLLTVPVEIQLIIICLLDDHRDRISLARCCSILLPVVQFASYNPQLKVPTPCSWKLEGLLHLLLHYPTLARGVQRLELGQASCDQHDHPALASESLDESVRDVVKKLSRDVEEELSWIDDLQHRQYPDAWMALILYLLPNLASLEWFWGGRGTQHTEILLTRVSLHEPPFDENPALQSLTEVFFKVTERTGAADPETNDPGFQITKMAPFFRLPSMRKLTGQMVCGRVPELVPQNSSPITHLELRQSSTASGFAELIAPCTNLKSFRYFHMDVLALLPNPYNRSFSYHNPIGFMAPLAEKADTLETLCLDYHPFVARFPVRSGRMFLGPFTNFHVLKHLRLPMANLMGHGDRAMRDGFEPMPLVDQLPPSLERLSVTEWDFRRCGRNEEELLDDMVQLVESKDRFQHLSNIEIHANILDMSQAETLYGWVKTRTTHYPRRDTFLDHKILAPTQNLAATCNRMGVVFTVHDILAEGLLHGFEDYFIHGEE